MAVKDVSITLNEIQWNTVLEIIWDDVGSGGNLDLMRYKIDIFDKIQYNLRNALEENDVNQ